MSAYMIFAGLKYPIGVVGELTCADDEYKIRFMEEGSSSHVVMTLHLPQEQAQELSDKLAPAGGVPNPDLADRLATTHPVEVIQKFYQDHLATLARLLLQVRQEKNIIASLNEALGRKHAEF